MAVTRPPSMQGKKIIVTRSHARGTAMVVQLHQWQAVPLWIPAISTTPGSPQQLARALAAVQACEWLVLPSPLAIEVFCEFALSRWPAAHWPKTAVMGRTSQSMLADRYRIEPTVVYDFARNASMAEQMALAGHEKVVVLRSGHGSGPRVAELACRHPGVDSYVVYAMECMENLVQALDGLEGPFDAVTFTSPSTVDCFMRAVEQLPHLQAWMPGACIACIGPATAQAINRHGLEVQVMCDQPSVDNLLWDLAHWFDGASE